MSWTSSKMRCTLKKFYGGSPIKGNHETLKISSPLEVKNPKRTFIHPHSDQQGLLWDKLPLFLYPAPWANKTLWMWMKILISLPQGGKRCRSGWSILQGSWRKRGYPTCYLSLWKLIFYIFFTPINYLYYVNYTAIDSLKYNSFEIT